MFKCLNVVIILRYTWCNNKDIQLEHNTVLKESSSVCSEFVIFFLEFCEVVDLLNTFWKLIPPVHTSNRKEMLPDV